MIQYFSLKYPYKLNRYTRTHTHTHISNATCNFQQDTKGDNQSRKPHCSKVETPVNNFSEMLFQFFLKI